MRKKEKYNEMRQVKKILWLVLVVLVLLPNIAAFHGTDVWAQEKTKAAESLLAVRQTTEGDVVGEEQSATHTLSWKGIPFAKAPVGDLRWRAPQPPDKRSAPFKAAGFCEICPQYIDHDRNPATPQVIQGNEDCLYLNIWRPKTDAVDLPVFFWIHGGGNSIQWPLLSNTDGAILAGKQNMIVVTVNYRLGPLGFLSHPSLRNGMKGDENGDSGNFALLDLIQALSWVKANIKNFGGDPANVTIVGESAGAQNVISLMASPLSRNLFHKAISQSGVIRMSTPHQGAQHANGLILKLFVKDGMASDEKSAEAKLKKMSGKDVADYLRAKHARELLALYAEGPVIGMFRFPNSFSDGKVLPVDFYEAMKAGAYNRVPVILGTNKEEAKLFLRNDPLFASWRTDGSLFKDPAKAELYDLAAQYQSDGWKVMGVDQLAGILRSNADQPMIYAYQFLWGAGSAKKSVLAPPFNVLLGACHAMEIDFVFGTGKASLGGLVFNDKNSPGRVALSNAMMDYWAQFARSGSPNREGSGLPGWKPWSNIEGYPKTILLDADSNTLKIEISRKELTEDHILKALQAEPRVKEIQPFWDNSRYRPSVR